LNCIVVNIQQRQAHVMKLDMLSVSVISSAGSFLTDFIFVVQSILEFNKF